jgi:uncharacterized protein (UPF0276 family)
VKLATPISSLFSDEEQASEIMAWSDCLECRDHTLEKRWPREELFHTDIQPIHHLEETDWQHLRRIRERKPDLRVLSMHLAACCDRPVITHGRFHPGGRAYSRGEMLGNARSNLTRIRNLFGDEIQLAVENNNYYPTPAYEFVCDGDFISELVFGNGIRFLFDLAHAHVTSRNRGIEYASYRDTLPLSAVIQVHLCRHGLGPDGTAFDAHNLPGEEEYAEFKELAGQHEVDYLTFEYYKESCGLIGCLQRATALRNEITGNVV